MKYMMATSFTCKFKNLQIGEIFKNPFTEKVYLKIATDLDPLSQKHMGSSRPDENKNAFCLDDNSLEYFLSDSNAVPLDPDLVLTEKRGSHA